MPKKKLPPNNCVIFNGTIQKLLVLQITKFLIAKCIFTKGVNKIMKRLITILMICLSIFLISGCSEETAANNKTLKIIVGTGGPGFKEVLEFVEPKVEKEGLTLDIIHSTDIIQPNVALNNGEIDANAIQHIPYMESFNKQNDADLVGAIKIIAWPSGLFSNKYKKIEDIPDGATISIPQDPSNLGRALFFLDQHGFIKLKEGVGLEATAKDIVENKRNFKLVELEQAMQANALDDVDLAFILGGYIQTVGLSIKDALIAEGDQSEFIGVIATKAENKDDERIKILEKALHSDETKKFIEEEFKGEIIPVFE